MVPLPIPPANLDDVFVLTSLDQPEAPLVPVVVAPLSDGDFVDLDAPPAPGMQVLTPPTVEGPQTPPSTAPGALAAIGGLASGNAAGGADAEPSGEMASIGGQAIIALLDHFGVDRSRGEDSESSPLPDELDAFNFSGLGASSAPDAPLDPFRDAIDPAWSTMLVLEPEGAINEPLNVAALAQLDTDLQSPDIPDGWVV